MLKRYITAYKKLPLKTFAFLLVPGSVFFAIMIVRRQHLVGNLTFCPMASRPPSLPGAPAQTLELQPRHFGALSGKGVVSKKKSRTCRAWCFKLENFWISLKRRNWTQLCMTFIESGISDRIFQGWSTWNWSAFKMPLKCLWRLKTLTLVRPLALCCFWMMERGVELLLCKVVLKTRSGQCRTRDSRTLSCLKR